MNKSQVLIKLSESFTNTTYQVGQRVYSDGKNCTVKSVDGMTYQLVDDEGNTFGAAEADIDSRLSDE